MTMSLHHKFDWRKDLGDQPALIHRGKCWSHHELHTQATLLAAALGRLDLSPNARVVVVLPNSAQAAIAHRGTLLAGCVVAPIAPSVPASLLNKIAVHADAEVLVTNHHYLARCELPSELICDVGDEGLVVAKLAGSKRLCPTKSEPDLSYLLYSSGTTAEPKAIAEVYAISPAIPSTSSEGCDIVTLGCALPFYHGMGRAYLFRMWAGCKVVLIDPFDPQELLHSIEENRINRISLVPSMGDALLRLDSVCKSYDLTSLEQVMLGGAPVPPSMVLALAELLRTQIVVGYGLSEGGHLSTAAGGKLGSAGRRKARGHYVRVVDHRGCSVPDGEAGEVEFECDLGQHYYKDPKETARVFHDGWVRTGDRGYFDADGDLFLIGRVQDSIIQAGLNLDPKEMEDTICLMEEVAECAVVGVPDRLLGDQSVAFVVAQPDHTIGAADVFSFCRDRLDERKLPISVKFVTALPKTELGKVQKRVLRERYLIERSGDRETDFVRAFRIAQPAVRPRMATRAIAVLLTEITGLDDCDPDLAFSELGISSLTAVRVAHALGELMGRPIAGTFCFEHPTISAMAKFVVAELTTESPLTALQTQPTLSYREPIAIIGMGCRFPGGADDPNELWRLLNSGTDCIREVPLHRWDMGDYFDPTPGVPGKTYSRFGAFLDAPNKVDAREFGLTPSEARKLGVHESLSLTVAAQTLRNGGYDASKRRLPEKTGVYVGAMSSGGAICGAISYRLDLRGPSVAMDAQCASSLAAVHAAVQSLRNGECDAALAGGTFLLESPTQFVRAAQLRLLSPDGRCRTFDAQAEGIGMAEGSGFVLLKPLSHAKRDGDQVLAIIRGTATNHSGRGSTPTAPSVSGIEAVIRAALRDGGIAPEAVGYVETHGTGTALGDPLEVKAISSALTDGRTEPLVLGALKTNMGHLQAAAGVAGLIKTVMVVREGTIPPNLHFKRLNPMLEPYADRMIFPTTATSWSANKKRVAGVTAIGLSGVNVHVVIEQADGITVPAASTSAERNHQIAESVPSPALFRSDGHRVAEDSNTELFRRLQLVAAEIVDSRPDQIDSGTDLLEMGMDSLRLLDFLDQAALLTNVRCQPGDFLSRPRLGTFAEYLEQKAQPKANTGKLVALRDRGTRKPLFCFHAIGGEVTPYFRLTARLGPDQPVFGIQSDDSGHAAVSELAHKYAQLVRARYSNGPVVLLGWSMGAILAHATTCVLEQSGAVIDRVFLIDPPRRRATRLDADPLRTVVVSTILSFDPANRIAEDNQRLEGIEQATAGNLLSWCIDRKILTGENISVNQFNEAVEIRMRQVQSTRKHSLGICKAPLKIWWAAEPDNASWDRYTESYAEEHVVVATHFSMVRSPLIDQLTPEILQAT